MLADLKNPLSLNRIIWRQQLQTPGPSQSLIHSSASHMIAGFYRIHDIVEKVLRNKTTIIRWEDEELIPRAPRDSRGWRYYTKELMEEIVHLVRESEHFTAHQFPPAAHPGSSSRVKKGDS